MNPYKAIEACIQCHFCDEEYWLWIEPFDPYPYAGVPKEWDYYGDEEGGEWTCPTCVEIQMNQ